MAEENQRKKVSKGQPQEPSSGPGSDSGLPEKKSWPELVGLTSGEAEKRISEEMPGAKIQVISQDSFVTFDFRLDRVRIFTDSAGRVAREPTVG